LSRQEALRMLETPPYPDQRQQEQDRVFLMKKLGFSEQQFEQYIRTPGVAHAVYGTELPMYRALLRIYRTVGGR
jgi:hypothetical protein